MDRVFQLLKLERRRQQEMLNLIASENYPSRAVLRVLGSVFQNKYSEGYPGRRYYPGNEYYDEVERLAIERVKRLFGAEHANVQPLSGALANAAVYYAFLEPGDTIMGLDLKAGGHLTHGFGRNFSGRFYKSAFYYLDKDGFLDYDGIASRVDEVKPSLLIAGFSAYPRDIDWQRFRKIADGIILLADIAHTAGLVAAGEQNSPVGIADVVTFTTQKTLRGPRGAVILAKKQDAKRIDRAVFPGVQAGPHMHAVAAKAVCFAEALSDGFKDYARQIRKNARALADALIDKGFVLSTGGTDNHLMLIDLRPEGITGAEAEQRLYNVGVVANRNLIPWDERPPNITSGIRFGTPALTSRGMREEEMTELAEIIASAIRGGDAQALRQKVRALAERFPVV